MKAKELHEKDIKSLNKLLTDTQAKIVKDRFAVAGKELTNVSEINKSRKLIAQIKTILNEREIFEAEKGVEKPAVKAKAEVKPKKAASVVAKVKTDKKADEKEGDK